MQLKTIAGSIAALLVVGCGGQDVDTGTVRSAAVTDATAVYPGVQHCDEVAAALGIEGPFTETTINPVETLDPTPYALNGGGSFTIDFTNPHTAFDWTATTGVRLVLVYYWVSDVAVPPGATSAYVYDPAAMAGGTLATPNGANVDLVKVCQIEAEEGCTYTQGYWKTHAEEGSKKYDETWDLLADGPDTAFFGTSMSWITVFNTAPKGNPYFILAHQYMAAKLNVLAGASDGSVGAYLTAAEAFFGAFTPTSTLTPAKRAEIIALADDLDEYNNGVIGPGHCGDEFVAE